MVMVPRQPRKAQPAAQPDFSGFVDDPSGGLRGPKGQTINKNPLKPKAAPNPGIVSRQRTLRAAGFQIAVDGVWGAQSQTAWKTYTTRGAPYRQPNEAPAAKPGGAVATARAIKQKTPADPHDADLAAAQKIIDKVKADKAAKQLAVKRIADELHTSEKLATRVTKDLSQASSMSIRDLARVTLDERLPNTYVTTPLGTKIWQTFLKSEGFTKVKVNGDWDRETHDAFVIARRRAEAAEKKKAATAVQEQYQRMGIVEGKSYNFLPFGAAPSAARLAQILQTDNFQSKQYFKAFAGQFFNKQQQWNAMKHAELLGLAGKFNPWGVANLPGDATTGSILMELAGITTLTPGSDPNNKWRIKQNQQALANLHSQIKAINNAKSIADFQNRIAHYTLVAEARFKDIEAQAAKDLPWWGKAIDNYINGVKWIGEAGVYSLMEIRQTASGDQDRDITWEDVRVVFGEDPVDPSSYDDLFKMSGPGRLVLQEIFMDPLNYVPIGKLGMLGLRQIARGAGFEASKMATLRLASAGDAALAYKRGMRGLGNEWWNQALVYQKGTWSKAAVLGIADNAGYLRVNHLAKKITQTRDQAIQNVNAKVALSAQHLHREPNYKVPGVEVKLYPPADPRTAQLFDEAVEETKMLFQSDQQLAWIFNTLRLSRSSLKRTAEKTVDSMVGASVKARIANWVDVQQRHGIATRYMHEVLLKYDVASQGFMRQHGIDPVELEQYLHRKDVINPETGMREARPGNVAPGTIRAPGGEKMPPPEIKTDANGNVIPQGAPVDPRPQDTEFARRYKAYLKDWKIYTETHGTAQEAAAKEYARVIEGSGLYTEGAGDKELEAELAQLVIKANQEVDTWWLPILQDMLEKDAISSRERVNALKQKLAVAKASGVDETDLATMEAKIVEAEADAWDVFDEAGYHDGGANEEAIRSLMDEAFDEKNLVTIPNHTFGRAFTKLERNDAIHGEVRRYMARVNYNIARNAATKGGKLLDAEAEFQKKLDDVSRHWVKRGDEYFDTRDTLRVPDVYARHHEELTRRVQLVTNATGPRVFDGIIRQLALPPYYAKGAQRGSIRGAGELDDSLGQFAWAIGGYHPLPAKGEARNVASKYKYTNRFDPYSLGIYGEDAAEVNTAHAKIQSVTERGMVLLALSHSEAASKLLLKEGAAWAALGYAQSWPLKKLHATMQGFLSVWIFATLPLRPGWVVRNVIDNFTKVIIAGMHDPRLILQGSEAPGVATRKMVRHLFEVNVRDLRAAAAFIDGLHNTKVAETIDQLMEHVWGMADGYLQRLFHMSGVEVPSHVVDNRFRTAFQDLRDGERKLGAPTYRAVSDNEPIYDDELQQLMGKYLKTRPKEAGVGQWWFDFDAKVKQSREALLDMMGNRPESNFRRIIYRAEVAKHTAAAKRIYEYRTLARHVEHVGGAEQYSIWQGAEGVEFMHSRDWEAIGAASDPVSNEELIAAVDRLLKGEYEPALMATRLKPANEIPELTDHGFDPGPVDAPAEDYETYFVSGHAEIQAAQQLGWSHYPVGIGSRFASPSEIGFNTLKPMQALKKVKKYEYMKTADELTYAKGKFVVNKDSLAYAKRDLGVHPDTPIHFNQTNGAVSRRGVYQWPTEEYPHGRIEVFINRKQLESLSSQKQMNEYIDQWTNTLFHELRHAHQYAGSFNRRTADMIRKADKLYRRVEDRYISEAQKIANKETTGMEVPYRVYKYRPVEIDARFGADRAAKRYPGLIHIGGSGVEDLPDDLWDHVRIDLDAHDKAIETVNATLFDYSQMTVIEDNFRFFFPFIQFMRKNTQFWIKQSIQKPWLPLSVLKLEQELKDSHDDWPEWMQRYSGEVSDAVASVPLLSEVLGLTGLKDSMYDPIHFLSFAPLITAYRTDNESLSEEEKGNKFFGPLFDAIADHGLGWNPIVRKPLESAHIANTRSWQFMFPQTGPAVALTRKFFGERAAGIVADWESLWGLLPLGVHSDAIARDYEKWVQQEMVGQYERGQTANRAQAEQTIKDWFVLQNVWGYFSGMYARRFTQADILLATMYDDVISGGVEYEDLSEKEKAEFKLWGMRGADRMAFDGYLTALPMIQAYYRQTSWEAGEKLKQENPEIVQWVDPAWKGQPWSDNYVATAQLRADTTSYFEASKFADDANVPYDVKKDAYTMFVTPELQAFWDKNDTPKQQRDKLVQAQAFLIDQKMNKAYFAIPATDYKARNAFIDDHPSMVASWNRNNSEYDDYNAVLKGANAALREQFSAIKARHGWDKANEFLRQHPFIFEDTAAAGKVDPITGEWKTHTARGHYYQQHRKEIKAFFALLHSAGKKAAFHWLNTSDDPAAAIVKAFFAMTGGGKRSAHAVAFLAAKPFLKIFFDLPEDEKEAWLNGDSEGAAIVRAYFKNWANKTGTTQHAKDYLAVKSIMDAYFAMSKADRREWIKNGSSEAQQLLDYFKKYSKVHQYEKSFVKAGFNPEGTPEEVSRLNFWRQYYSLTPDQRPAFVHANAEEAGIFMYGFFGDEQRHDAEAAWMRRAIGAGMNEKQAAYLYVKPLLDFYYQLPEDEQPLFARANPEIQEYFDKFTDSSPTGDPNLDPLVEEYFKLPTGSLQRSQFLREHPEVQDFFDKRSTPAELAMRKVLEQYFQILSAKDRKRFADLHPEIRAYFDQRRVERANEKAQYMAFDESDPRLKPFFDNAEDMIRGAEVMRRKLARAAQKELSVAYRGRDGREPQATV